MIVIRWLYNSYTVGCLIRLMRRRHCERSEAIQKKKRINTSLAMTRRRFNI